MHLKAFFVGVSEELVLFGRRYEARRFEHPVLASYASIPSLLAPTEPRKEGNEKKKKVSPEGAAVLSALVDLNRRTRDRLWGTLLLRAFQPLLLGLAPRLIGGQREDRALLLLSSFNEAVLLRVDPFHDPVRIAMYVAQETRRVVFRDLAKELDWDKAAFGEDADDYADENALDPPCIRGEEVLDRVRRPASRDALLETSTTRGSLRAAVRAHYGTLPAEEQKRIYERLRRRCRRELAKQRATDAAQEVEL